MADSTYTEDRARAMAEMVLTKTLAVKAGEAVTIETWDSTLSWAKAFVLEARKLGARPLLILEDEETYWRSLKEASPKLLGTPGKHEWALLEKTNAYVFFYGPSDTVREAALPEKTQEELWAFEDKWFETASRVGLRVARMYLGRVSEKAAKEYRIDANAWRRELVDAALIDPAEMHRVGLRLAARLRKGTKVTVTHPNGTELELSLKHREPRLFSGLLNGKRGANGRGPGHAEFQDTPVPGGYLAVAVDESFAEGRFQSNVSTGLTATDATGGRWEFRNGHLISRAYVSGGDEFDKEYAAAGKGRDLPGTITIGLNPKIKIAPFMRDQALGTVTLTLGSNRHYGGTTDAHFHPWLLLDGANLKVDGRALVKNGKIV